ncbi:A/G-specific adenine glycosylase [Jannaschia rubra]|uniref:Adenine DNA glycosylase n=1 Tax=Jannaschia rubra TaxID=282197 RepID=A0A0M6XRB4_9RHOB|nr:A/G-specific adenine glycosylase [Jannaschia rubra]CTQ32574.1 A/G-specific adenine glycosylase [Jannaschia rubra]SFF85262.1 A/G-specific DNA-adenine glycosylase [Jannaschia rubra]
MRDPRTERLAAWYGANARDLPWRVPPGDPTPPDPYRVWLSEVMLQQTTVAAVRDYFARFTTLWPTVHDLAAAEDAAVMAAWAGLGYYARARNLLKCARAVVSDHGGRFPDTEAALLTLPGIGPYTAAAIAAIAFGRPAVVVDGNVERVMARLGAIQTPLPAAKPEIRALAACLTPEVLPGDHAQAVMDLGATLCTPRKPTCMLCPLADGCEGRRLGVAESLPRKAPKVPKPERSGFVYLARLGDLWLVETRPAKGLLGGMLAFPTSDWGAHPASDPPFDAPWREVGQVRHTFTHFHLTLTVMTAETRANPDRGNFAPLDPDALPTLFGKAHALVTQGSAATA